VLSLLSPLVHVQCGVLEFVLLLLIAGHPGFLVCELESGCAEHLCSVFLARVCGCASLIRVYHHISYPLSLPLLRVLHLPASCGRHCLHIRTYVQSELQCGTAALNKLELLPD
jgi:hypothetical protein